MILIKSCSVLYSVKRKLNQNKLSIMNKKFARQLKSYREAINAEFIYTVVTLHAKPNLRHHFRRWYSVFNKYVNTFQ